jgi:predicted O-methyltransferase YrrM
MIFSRAFRYLNYSILSHHRHGHGIHSPFVFDVVSKVFRNKTDAGVVNSAEMIRKKMISDNRSIVINDLGAGSRKFKSNSRRVSDIARYSPVTPKYGRLLSAMAASFGAPMIIELGTSLGISTAYMAGSCFPTTVYTIEGCHATAAIAHENFTEAGLSNIKILEGSFEEILPSFAKNPDTPGLVFIDGNHRKEPVIRYFNEIAAISGRDTVVIVDDINYSKEMAEAWNELKKHERVSVSIDVFRMGILFFREGISHNEYVIRY